MSNTKVGTQIALPLEPAPPVEKATFKPIDPHAIIRRLYELAMDGNVTAARVVLDYCREQENEGKEHDLAPGDILALIRTTMQSMT